MNKKTQIILGIAITLIIVVGGWVLIGYFKETTTAQNDGVVEYYQYYCNATNSTMETYDWLIVVYHNYSSGWEDRCNRTEETSDYYIHHLFSNWNDLCYWYYLPKPFSRTVNDPIVTLNPIIAKNPGVVV